MLQYFLYGLLHVSAGFTKAHPSGSWLWPPVAGRSCSRGHRGRREGGDEGSGRTHKKPWYVACLQFAVPKASLRVCLILSQGEPRWMIDAILWANYQGTQYQLSGLASPGGRSVGRWATWTQHRAVVGGGRIWKVESLSKPGDASGFCDIFVPKLIVWRTKTSKETQRVFAASCETNPNQRHDVWCLMMSLSASVLQPGSILNSSSTISVDVFSTAQIHKTLALLPGNLRERRLPGFEDEGGRGWPWPWHQLRRTYRKCTVTVWKIMEIWWCRMTLAVVSWVLSPWFEQQERDCLTRAGLAASGFNCTLLSIGGLLILFMTIIDKSLTI